MKTTKEACFSSPLLQVKKQARGKYVPCLMTHIRNTILRNIRIGPLVFLIQFSAQPKLTVACVWSMYREQILGLHPGLPIQTFR